MLIEKIDIQNYKSFAGKHSFTINRGPGIHFLTGENRAEPRLGSNGSGKSSLLGAIYWCLYGRDPDKLRAGDIKAWGSRGAVKVQMQVGDHDILRTWGPNSLTVDGKAVTQEELEEIVGLNEKEFSHTVLLSQFGSMFFDLGNTDKLALLSNVLNLDYWLGMSDRASATAKDLDGDVAECKQELASIKDQLSVHRTNIKAYKQEAIRTAKEDKEELAELKKELKKIENRLATAQKQYDDIAGDVEGGEMLLEQQQDKLDQLIEEERALEKKVAALHRERAKLQGQMDAQQGYVDELEDMDECPTCGQGISKRHLKACQEAAAAKNKAVQRELDKLAGQLAKLTDTGTQDAQDALQEEVRKIRSDLRVRRQEADEARATLRALQHAQKTAQKDIARIEKRIKDGGPYERFIKEARRVIKQLKKERAELTEELAETEAALEAVRYWVKGFKDVRLFLVEEAITQLELECNNYLSELGLVDWSINFAAERETASGGVTRGFTVSITPPGSKKPVPWAAYSGGETQRLRVAGALGLSNLILSRKGIQGAPLILDEPTPFLNDGGVQDLLESLQSYAEKNDRVIWLIDHRTLTFGGFKSVSKVVKTEEGSHIA